MDSLTQIVLGASVAALCVPSHHRRKAVIAGAVLGTLPDLDVLLDYGNAVDNFTYHRGFSHSLFVLLPFSLLLWAVLRRFYEPVRSTPIPWLFAIVLALLTHPLLDAHTAYGTQLFWPLSSPPIMWSTLFIIDPLYTLPLLIGMICILIRPHKAWAMKILSSGLIISSLYVGWTWIGKHIVNHQVIVALEEQVETTDVFTTPTPFNSFLWRVVVLQENNYLESYYSLLAPSQPIRFTAHPQHTNAFEQNQNLPSVTRLHWFNHGFMKSEVINDELVITDLRMGIEDNYVFQHSVAEVSDNLWREINSYQRQSDFNPEALFNLWEKLLGREPHQ